MKNRVIACALSAGFLVYGGLVWAAQPSSLYNSSARQFVDDCSENPSATVMCSTIIAGTLSGNEIGHKQAYEALGKEAPECAVTPQGQYSFEGANALRGIRLTHMVFKFIKDSPELQNASLQEALFKAMVHLAPCE